MCEGQDDNRGVRATFGQMVLLIARALIFHFAERGLGSLVCDLFPYIISC